MKRLALLILLTGLLVAVSAGPAMADPPTPVTCGRMIMTPGQYVLAGDCTGFGIRIVASDVHLKLDGHTMTGSFGDAGLEVINVSHVHIEGPGTIRSHSLGIEFNGVSDSHVEQVMSVNNTFDGFFLANVANIHVNNSVFSMNGQIGLFFSNNCTDNHVDNNQTLGNSSNGIRLNATVTSSRVNGNTALGNGTDLEDDNSNCDDNKWNGNRFNTSSQPCIH
jgi:Periplasmic copper-binding protein (NosD)